MAASTRSRTVSRTFGSLLSTRDTVFFEVPEARATSSMVARVMKVWPDSMIRSLRSVGLAFDGDRDASVGNVPSAHLDDRRRGSARRIARGEGDRLARPQRDVIVAPQ